MNANPEARRLFSLRRIKRDTFVNHVEYHRVLPSTNTRAIELAATAETPIPALVVTEAQTAGRGRGENMWWSASGALTFSLVLDLNATDNRPESWPKFALAAAVGVCDALESFAAGTHFGIRWPNDVCCGPKKICGILPELQMSASPRLILGVGINANNSMSKAPEELCATATSLVDITGRRANLTSVLIDVVCALERRFAELAVSAPELSTAWSDRCLLRGRHVRLGLGAEDVEGPCTGIDANGALGLQIAGGVRRFYGGTVAHIGDSLTDASS